MAAPLELPSAGPVGDASAAEIALALAEVVESLRVIAEAAESARDLPDARLIEAQVAQGAAMRMLLGIGVSLAGAIDARSGRDRGPDGLAAQHGQRSAKALIAVLTGCSELTSWRAVRLARTTLPRPTLHGVEAPALFPALGVAITSGRAHGDAGTAIVDVLEKPATRIHPEELAIAERELVNCASDAGGDANAHGHVSNTGLAADLVKHAARMWEAFLDPDGAEPDEKRAFERRGLAFRPDRPGSEVMTATMPTEMAAEIKGIISTFTNPKRASSSDEAGVGAADERAWPQRAMDVLHALIGAGARPESPIGSTPQLAAVVHVDDLAAAEDAPRIGDAWLEFSDTPVSARTARRLACFGDVRIVVTGDHGETTAAGEPKRLFSTAQRKAMAVRDGGCAWIGCTAPPSWTEAHHVEWYSRGGRTSIDNGVLLCAFHHRVVHQEEWSIVMRPGPNGARPYLVAPPYVDPTRTPRPMGRPTPAARFSRGRGRTLDRNGGANDDGPPSADVENGQSSGG